MAARALFKTYLGGIEVTDSLNAAQTARNNGAQYETAAPAAHLNSYTDTNTCTSSNTENQELAVFNLARILCNKPTLAPIVTNQQSGIDGESLPDTPSGRIIRGFLTTCQDSRLIGKTDAVALQCQEWAHQCAIIHPEIATVGLPDGVNSSNVFSETKRLAGLLTTSHKTRRFTFSPLTEVLLRTDPVYLVHRLLVAGGTSLLTAKHASFKSFFALHIALSIALGKLWHGYEVKKGAVVYIAAEGAAGSKHRAAAWLAHHHQTPPENFYVVDIPTRIHEQNERAAFIEDMKAMLRGELPALIVLDTLARCAIGLDENNAGDMGLFADAIGDLARETGAHVMVVHHNNRGGEYRGSSAVPAAVDTHLSIERRGDIVTLKIEKQKDDEELPELIFEKVVVPIPNTKGEKHSLVFNRLNTRSGGRGAMNDIEQKAFDALLDTYGNDIVSNAQWKRAADEQKQIPESTFAKACRGLLAKKAVLMVSGEKGGKGNNAPRYQVSPEWAPASTDEETIAALPEEPENTGKDSQEVQQE